MCHRRNRGRAPGSGVYLLSLGLIICLLKSKCYDARSVGWKICSTTEMANAAGMEYPGEEDFSWWKGLSLEGPVCPVDKGQNFGNNEVG